jgi:hypothetical protein
LSEALVFDIFTAVSAMAVPAFLKGIAANAAERKKPRTTLEKCPGYVWL